MHDYPPHHKQSLVTVTVAAYNAEAWLSVLLYSISRQVYENWECIVVDDGSTDRTPEIADRFCKSDSRFRLITQVNQGIPAARNTGLEYARGDFILFVDADDELMENCIGYCIENIENCDILAADCMAVDEMGHAIRQTKQPSTGVVNREHALQLYLDCKILTSVWSKFYRIQTIGVQRFNTRLLSAQDLYFNTELFLRNPGIRVKVVNEPIYRYRILPSSISHIKDEKRMKRLITQVCEMDMLATEYAEIIEKECSQQFARKMIKDILYQFQLQQTVKHLRPDLADLLKKWHGELNSSCSPELKDATYVLANKNSWMKLTLHYLPQTLITYLRKIKQKWKK